MDESLIQADRTVKIFLDSLDEQLEVDWSLESMALRCELGRTRFSHYCRKLTNKTPLVYLNHLRVQKAAQLLKQSSLSAQDIADQCGFHSSQYFSTQFKKFFKTTPNKFRNFEAQIFSTLTIGKFCNLDLSCLSLIYRYKKVKESV